MKLAQYLKPVQLEVMIATAGSPSSTPAATGSPSSTPAAAGSPSSTPATAGSPSSAPEARVYSAELYHGSVREPLSCGCCCKSHCSVSFHNLYGTKSIKTKLSEQCFLQLESGMNASAVHTDVAVYEDEAYKPARKSVTDLIFGVGISF